MTDGRFSVGHDRACAEEYLRLNHCSGHRILLATDLPFWHQSDGAQQRIEQLTSQLIAWGAEVQVFYLGPDEALSRADDFEFPIVHASSHEPPQQLGPKLKWYWQAIHHQIRVKAQSSSPAAENSSSAMRLADFEWPWARQKFTELFRHFRPTCLIIEYAKLAYLLKGLTQTERENCLCCLDTHDVLHLRARQFKDRGLDHWIEISEREEAAALADFDHVLAIQESEAEKFRQMLAQTPSETTVFVVGFAAKRPTGEGSAFEDFLDPTGPTFGYIGSKNDSNMDAANWLINCLWKKIRSHISSAKLVIAGSVCDTLEIDRRGDIQILGRVENVKDFYGTVDICLNPVRFGTGLKIKNMEALSFGRPLITTSKGWEGLPMPEDKQTGILVAETEEAFVDAVISMGLDRDEFATRVHSAVFFSNNEFSSDQAYSQLRTLLETNNR